MRRLLTLFAIFLLGFGVSQLFTFFLSPQSSVGALIKNTKEATDGGVLGQENSDETFIVKRVVDGDTIELADGRKVRYIGIDTPETVDPRQGVGCFGREASSENKRLVEGKSVRLEKDISETDRYGRLLRYVYVDDMMINDALVRGGFAYASSYSPDIQHQEQFVAAQREAREKERGLWSACASNITNTTNTTNVTNATNKTETPVANTTPVQVQNLQSNSSCTIKGNVSTKGEKIYHLAGCGSYDKTAIDESTGERWFCTEKEAEDAGWRKAKNC